MVKEYKFVEIIEKLKNVEGGIDSGGFRVSIGDISMLGERLKVEFFWGMEDNGKCMVLLWEIDDRKIRGVSYYVRNLKRLRDI